jgi:NAD(P)H-flavin reductase
VGEVPISIMSDPEDRNGIGHTIRALGRVTKGLAALQPGDSVGLRGPYGRGWPLQEVSGCDIVLVTGGLGCAPVVSVIHYILKRRERFGKLVIIQGVRHAEDLIWREQYERWAKLPDLTTAERLLVLPSIVLMFVLGIWPQFILGAVDATVVNLVQQLNF